MGESWATHEFSVGMPHTAPGGKLSEVELLKVLGDHQWLAIADALGTSTQDIVNDQNERLYSSFIDIELHFGDESSPDRLSEGTRVFVRNRVRFYAGRFVEGLIVFGDAPIPEDELRGLETRRDLESLRLPWVCMTNAFVARQGGNTRLKVHAPVGVEAGSVPQLREVPSGIENHRRVQSTGRIDDFGDAFRPSPLATRTADPISYPITPESDLNGAGLVYFARYPAMMNYGERIFLGEHLERGLSSDLAACLSTDHRRIYYFANASPTDTVLISTQVALLAPGDFPAPQPGRWRTPFKLVVRTDLHRKTDKVLMASSLVRKSLNVPADQKGILMEAERFLANLP